MYHLTKWKRLKKEKRMANWKFNPEFAFECSKFEILVELQ